jgi:5-methylcytosine-specific restriction endonuclease McrA
VSSIITKNLVLVLHSVMWQPIGFISIKKAIKAMCSDDVDAAQALDLDYELNDEGYIDFMKPIKYVPLGVEEWFKLPIRDFDIPIHSTKSVYRAPIVILTHHCKKMPSKQLKPTRRNLWEFYGRKCYWTGKELSYSECTKEHIDPKSRGGGDSWANLAPASKKINNERGNIPVDKWKYKPQYKLKEPPKMPVSTFIRHAARPEWQYFILSNK